MNSLVGISPAQALPHGPTKIFLDEFLWHEPTLGVVAKYEPKESDLKDHFGLFRGADQIEMFGQTSVVAANAFISCKKKNIGFDQLYKDYVFVFMKMGEAVCKSFIKSGEVAVAYAYIVDYKFKQMTASGTIYKCRSDFDLRGYYRYYSHERFKLRETPEVFTEVTEFNNLIGRGIKAEKIMNL